MLKLPPELKSLFWSYDFDALDPEKDKKRIVVNVVNYGKWRDWRWLVKYYGSQEVKSVIEETPVTEFRPQALKLISLLLGIVFFNHVSRSINR